jgi:hypothetical protein
MAEETAGGFAWKLPAMAAVTVLVTAGPLIWSRDFGWFLFLLFLYAPILACVCLALLIRGFFAGKSGTRLTFIATALTVGTMLAGLYFTAAPVSDFLHDRAGFWVWYATHRDVPGRYAKRDAIIIDWDDWGMAGMSFFSFLVSDPDDSIGGSTRNATVWARRLKSDCAVTGVTRLERGLYILDTYNCPLTDAR